MGRSDVTPAATPPLPTPEDLAARLAELAEKAGLPGASVAVRVGDRTVTAAVGVLDVETGYPATTDSIFQIGSITKVWTATLVLQLVDEGLLDLDAPVRTYLPDFRLVDEDAAGRVTIRHLLSHTGGFEGDIFDDHGAGDDAVAKLVAGMATTAGPLFAPGEMFSYCNSGLVVLGRVVEVLTGLTWEAALRERIVVPLGLTRVATDAAEAIIHRAAIGHVEGPDGTDVKAPFYVMPRAGAPAGTSLATTAADLLEFAAAHVCRGLLPDGTRLLSEVGARAMCVPQVELPGMPGHAWGLGWHLYDWPGALVVGHDGGTIGQNALLRVVPSRGVSIAILTNGSGLYGLYDLVRDLLGTLAGVAVPELPVPPAEPVAADTGYFLGRYASQSAAIEVAETEDGLTVGTRALGALGDLVGDRVAVQHVVIADARTLVATTSAGGQYARFTFIGDGNRADYLHAGRAVPRADTTAAG